MITDETLCITIFISIRSLLAEILRKKFGSKFSVKGKLLFHLKRQNLAGTDEWKSSTKILNAFDKYVSRDFQVSKIICN